MEKKGTAEVTAYVFTALALLAILGACIGSVLLSMLLVVKQIECSPSGCNDAVSMVAYAVWWSGAAAAYVVGTRRVVKGDRSARKVVAAVGVSLGVLAAASAFGTLLIFVATA